MGSYEFNVGGDGEFPPSSVLVGCRDVSAESWGRFLVVVVSVGGLGGSGDVPNEGVNF